MLGPEDEGEGGGEGGVRGSLERRGTRTVSMLGPEDEGEGGMGGSD